MKKGALLFLVIGLAVGFAIGHVSKPDGLPAAPDAQPASALTAEPMDHEPAAKNRPQEQELLLQAIQELNLTTTEL